MIILQQNNTISINLPRKLLSFRCVDDVVPLILWRNLIRSLEKSHRELCPQHPAHSLVDNIIAQTSRGNQLRYGSIVEAPTTHLDVSASGEGIESDALVALCDWVVVFIQRCWTNVERTG